jgi:hypothetical protein
MDQLERLFGQYREALPDPEPSAAFTPGVWQRIEARRSPVRILRRMTEALVTMAAVSALVISFVIPRVQSSPVYSATYVDVLAAEQSPDALADDALSAEIPPQEPLR